MTAQAFFLPVDAEPGAPASPGPRFCLFHPARAAVPRGVVVHAPAFGEEMNKSRRMVAEQARGLALLGFSVLLIDPLGCGDSAGDFGDATWAAWVADLVAAARWLRARDAAHAAAPLWFWGLRAGCLLAVEAAAALGAPCDFCFWQPPAAGGKTLLQQFLRLKVAAEMLDGGAKGAMEQVKQTLAAGASVEIAGYALAPALAQGLEAARFAPPAVAPGRLVWLEVANQTGTTASPVAAKAMAAWREAGWALDADTVQGPAFWQTVEIEVAPALLAATRARLVTTPDTGGPRSA